MAKKKTKRKPKGVLVRLGEMATMAADVVIDAGSKAVHAVGSMMPSGPPKQSAKASPRASKPKAPKAVASTTSKSTPKTAKLSARGAKVAVKPSKTRNKVGANTATPERKTKKFATKKAIATKPASSTAKASHSSKPKRRAGRDTLSSGLPIQLLTSLRPIGST